MSVNEIDVNAVNERTKKEEIPSFDLPAVDESAPKAKPRIHRTPVDSTCISCEG